MKARVTEQLNYSLRYIAIPEKDRCKVKLVK
jgi:hypothetical protein